MCVREKEATLFTHYIFWLWLAGVVFLSWASSPCAKNSPLLPARQGHCPRPGLRRFGARHLRNRAFPQRRAFSPGVPSWIPFHPFWIVFVGAALFAGALSLAWNRYTRLSSTLLAIMLFIFVLTLHIPRVAATTTAFPGLSSCATPPLPEASSPSPDHSPRGRSRSSSSDA